MKSSFQGLSAVVDCIYTTKIKVNYKNLPDLLSAASMLQVIDIMDECKEFMEKNMKKTTCFTFLNLAEKYSMNAIERAANDFVLQNFEIVNQTKAFYEITQKSLCWYLSSNFLRTNNREVDVYNVAKKWLQANKITDSKVVYDVMKHVRFGLMPPSTVSEMMYDEIIIENKECRKILLEATKYHNEVFKQPFYAGNLNKPRGAEGLVVIPNGVRDTGFDVKGKGEDLHMYSMVSEKSHSCQSFKMPVVYESMTSVTIGNFLFVFGVESDGYQNFTKRYDASSNTWIDLKPVPRCTAVGHVSVLGDQTILLVGGMPISKATRYKILNDNLLNVVYKYSIQTNTWEECATLPIKAAWSAAASEHGKIFTTGGCTYILDARSVTARVFQYDLKGDVWLTKQPMKNARCDHILEAFDHLGQICTVGGMLLDGTPVRPIELYDPMKDQWTTLLENGPGVIGAASCTNNGFKIYFSTTRGTIGIYQWMDKETRVFTYIKLPEGCRRSQLAVMILPSLM